MQFPKKFSVKIGASVLAIMTVVTPALAATATVNTTSGLNMRSGAGTNYSIMKTLPYRATVDVISTSNGWSQITYQGTKGYVSSTYLTTSSSTTTTKGTVKDGPLNVRSGPSTSYSRIGSLAVGTTVEILSSSNGWYKIKTASGTGYVSSTYISVGSSKSTSTSTTTSTATTGHVSSGPLNIRSGPSTGYSKIGSLATGSTVTILGTENGWYKIKTASGTGYVSSAYVTLGAAKSTAPAASYVCVTSGPLNIRSGPSTGYSIVGRLSTGSVVQVTGQTNGWYKISQGYISSQYVRTATAAEAASPTTAKHSGIGADMAEYAKSLVGCRYVYGGSSPSGGFDCSGFTYYVCKHFGYTINRTASAQMSNGTAVSRSNLKPGDLVMFNSGNSSKRATHVGMYIGGNQFVHASTSSTGVIISNINSSYYSPIFVGARRIA